MDNGQSPPDGHLWQPVSWLARRTIERRLERVVRLFPKAAKHPERDVEYVHGLRVAIRRATAALQMFSLCLPRSQYAEVRSQLRRIRRAAGPARDLDVLEERLSRLAIAGGTTAQLGAAIDQVRRRRKKAGKTLLKVYKRARERDFKGLVRSLSKQVAWRGDGPEPALVDWAGAELSPSIDRFLARSSSNLTDPKALHRMRIAEKRMRYSLEVLGGWSVRPWNRWLRFSESFRRGLERSVTTKRLGYCCFDGATGPRTTGCARCSLILPRLKSGRGATYTMIS